MTEILQSLADNSEWPILTAIALGLLSALSPCPMATNVAAVGYISKNIESRNRALANGLLYGLGRVAVYSFLGVALLEILKFGGEIYDVQKVVIKYGEFILPPFLIFCGIAILFAHKLKISGISVGGFASKIRPDGIGAFLLGAVFAAAFCPTSAMLFFGLLVPLAATCTYGILLPTIFGIMTAIPVVIFAVMLAYGIGNVGRTFGKLAKFEKFLKVFVGSIFLIIGLYYLIIL